MRVAIAGGHGDIAMLLTRMLEERGDEVISLIRDPDQEAEIREVGGTPVICDLEECDAQEIAAKVGKADAIVFAAGAGPDSGPERKETLDYEGAVKLVAAAGSIHPKRYVMISSMGADSEHTGDEVFDVYLRAKGKADEELMASGVPYTIVRPGALTDEQGTGRVEAGESVSRSEIPREDVASVIAHVLRDQNAEDTVFEVVSGDTPVAEILS